jgi:endonuclease-3
VKRTAVAKIHAALAREYGPQGDVVPEDPLDVLISTILSQNTTGANSTRAFERLRRAFPRWSRILAVTPRAVERQIRTAGLGRTKSRRIQQVLRLIRCREGRLSLDRLRGVSDAEALRHLESLPGVGPKTARCVLLFGFGRPVMPVDTHVFRIARRLGWLRPRITVEKAGANLERIIPPRLVLALHLYLIDHGRRVCRPSRPRCHRCVLRRFCPFPG